MNLFEPEIVGLERIAVDSALFKVQPVKYKRSVTLDSTGQYISISESLDQTEFFLPTVMDLDDYVRFRIRYDQEQAWKKAILDKYKLQKEEEFGAIRLDIPFRIKSKTFTRIFGSDRIGLKVTGNISFDLSGRTEKRSGSAVSQLEDQGTFSPRFKQTQQFTVEGHIGEKVTVSVEQNSEAIMEIENTLKLRYKGDEDEIVQSIEAGNIGLSLPSTKYVIFGGSNKGLFGLKTDMKIGNLNFTGIASIEKGEQKELTISGGAQSNTEKIKNTDFEKNRYFFIDESYRANFEKGLLNDPIKWNWDANKKVDRINVWISVSVGEPNALDGLAAVNFGDYANITSQSQLNAISTIEDVVYKGSFKKLEETEYELDEYRGILSLNQSVTNQILAVSYITADKNKVGTLDEDLASSTDSVIVLKMIKERTSNPDYKNTWPLMLRNVYSLRGTDIEDEGFEVRIEYNKNGQQERFPDDDPEHSFLNLMGLDILDDNGALTEGGDDKIDNNQSLIFKKKGILFFPSLTPFNPDSSITDRYMIPKKYRSDMYNLRDTETDKFNDAYKFDIIVNSRSTKTSFPLGFYVLEGSEVVTLGGVTLKRDVDYRIDYFSGTLTLESAEAKRSSSDIQIKYERANIFQLDKKSIFGGRLEYNLWENAFIGLTALYLNKSTLDRRVRVGQEPFSNFVWDLNTAFKFKPRFLTRWADALPVVETNAESQFNIEAEFAQVLPNPNTLNSESTGDNNGVAYLDDFESSKRTTTLGIRYRTWTMASAPAELPDNIGMTAVDDVEEADSLRARIAWFNPYTQVHINDIWPNKDVNSQTGQTTDVLGVDIWREPDADPQKSWAGFMRSTYSFPDQSKSKFIELWVLGDEGTAHIDIGQISEDWYIKGLNYRNFPSKGNINYEDVNDTEVLDEGEDVGIDGIPDGQPGDDPYDNWYAPVDDERMKGGLFDGRRYDGINGTEGNSNSREARYPDTEDMDGDGQVSTNNNYFQYTFDLDDINSDWIVSTTPKGWKQYRIPLKDFTAKVGNPSFFQIYFTRVWFSNLPAATEERPQDRTRILMATFDFVGNEWQETGIAHEDSTSFGLNDSLFILETYNTEENTEAGADRIPYYSPPGVSGVRDRITEAMSKEQSLAMRLIGTGLPARHKAEAKKSLYNALDLTNYEKMRMFIYGFKADEHNPTINLLQDKPSSTDSSNIRFYIRFGSDDNNYYEYSQHIYSEWNTLNNMDIDLDKLAGIKYSQDSVTSGPIIVSIDDVPGGYYKSVGNPMVSNIKYFIIGVLNEDENEPLIGEIWLDELRLSNVRKNKATALRLKANLSVADIFSINAQWESVDADFHNVSTQFGKGSTAETQNYSGKVNVDKFLPSFFDLSIPIDARANFNRSIPKYLPGTDKLSGYQNNTVGEKLESLFGTKKIDPELEEKISKSETYGIGTTIKKRTKSNNFLLRYTLDGLTFDTDYSYKNSSDWKTVYSKSEQYKTAIRYAITFGKDNYLTPLYFIKGIPILGKFSEQKLYYMPNNINLSLNVTDSKTQILNRSSSNVQNTAKITPSTGTSRSFSTTYKMLDNLDFSLTRSHQTDADADSLSHKQLWNQIFTKGYFGIETNISQSFKSNFRPNVASWFTPDYSFSSNYTYQLASLKYRNTSQKVDHRFGLKLKPGALLKLIYDPDKSKSGDFGAPSTKGRGRPKRTETPETTEENAEPEDPKPERKKVSLPNPFTILYRALLDWQTVSATLTISNNINHQTLASIPSWKYQLGFSEDPGVLQDSSLNVQLIPPTTNHTVRLNTNTGFNISKNIKVSLDHQYDESEKTSENGRIKSGSRSRTYLIMGDNPEESFKDFYGDFMGFIPDWKVNISGVEKILFFPQIAKSMSVEHVHTSKVSQRMQLDTDGENYYASRTSFSSGWSPLIGINIKTKWGVNGTIRYTNSTSLNSSASSGADKTESNQMSITLNYALSSGFKIPIPFWPFNNKSFKNEMNITVTYDASKNKTFQRQRDQKKFEEKRSDSNWKLRPSATYRFSSRVQGSLFYETSTITNKVTGTTSINEFGISVNIAIRD
ncbi:MAG: cell surface protein SprA [Calditrichaceae bacterium]|nr:cell surface protein SprA [Calditrichaceae bacterium]